MNQNLYTRFTLWANRTIMLALAVLAASMPPLLRWYAALRPLSVQAAWAVGIAFYCCCVPVAAALWDLDCILRNIMNEKVFVHGNVRLVRRIRWYCLTTGLICLPAACYYLPLIFVVIMMGFLALVVSVLSSVMAAAVEIREENDLMI